MHTRSLRTKQKMHCAGSITVLDYASGLVRSRKKRLDPHHAVHVLHSKNTFPYNWKLCTIAASYTSGSGSPVPGASYARKYICEKTGHRKPVYAAANVPDNVALRKPGFQKDNADFSETGCNRNLRDVLRCMGKNAQAGRSGAHGLFASQDTDRRAPRAISLAPATIHCNFDCTGLYFACIPYIADATLPCPKPRHAGYTEKSFCTQQNATGRQYLQKNRVFAQASGNFLFQPETDHCNNVLWFCGRSVPGRGENHSCIRTIVHPACSFLHAPQKTWLHFCLENRIIMQPF